MKILLISLSAVVATLSACGGEGSSSPSAPPPISVQTPEPARNGSSLLTGTSLVLSGITVPPPPDDTDNAATAGIDTNGNGVRDDVERLIALAYGGNAQNYRAVMQKAKRMQSILAPATMDAATVQSLMTAGIEEARCFAQSSFNGDFAAASRANQVVVGATLNTQDRIKRYRSRLSLASSVIDLDFQKVCQ